MNPLIIIDNGHGAETPGKQSPDGRLREWAWAREIARMLADELAQRGIEAVLLAPEDKDTSLLERCRRANTLCRQRCPQNCALVSIHANAAASDGHWHNARGFSAFVSPNASDKSKRLAAILDARAHGMGLGGNRARQAGGYWVGNFSIIRDTRCPAVLTENLFQDNREDVEYLLSDAGKRAIVQLHADAIAEYITEL